MRGKISWGRRDLMLTWTQTKTYLAWDCEHKLNYTQTKWNQGWEKMRITHVSVLFWPLNASLSLFKERKKGRKEGRTKWTCRSACSFLAADKKGRHLHIVMSAVLTTDLDPVWRKIWNSCLQLPLGKSCYSCKKYWHQFNLCNSKECCKMVPSCLIHWSHKNAS